MVETMHCGLVRHHSVKRLSGISPTKSPRTGGLVLTIFGMKPRMMTVENLQIKLGMILSK